MTIDSTGVWSHIHSLSDVFCTLCRYVVVCGEPGARLVDMVVAPHALVANPSTLHLHVVYYITKQVIVRSVFSIGARCCLMVWVLDEMI